MSAYGDTELAESVVAPLNKLYITSIEPTNPVTNDVWFDSENRRFQVFNGVVWEDFYGTASDADTLVWDNLSKQWVPQNPMLVSPNGTEFVIVVSDGGNLSTTAV